jgi:competence protein ComEC
MASRAAAAPSMRDRALQIASGGAVLARGERLERWLEAERDQLPLWIPVAFGTGIAGWLTLGEPREWLALIAFGLGLAMAGAALGRGGRAGRALAIAGLCVALGCAAIWWRAERVAAPVLARPVVASFSGRVEAVEPLPARAVTRLRIAVDDAAAMGLPPRVRVNVTDREGVEPVAPGAEVRLRARLMPPVPAAVPGAYDFERVAWFQGIGATGRALGDVEVTRPGRATGEGLRVALTRHVQSRIEGSAGGVAAALATGDRGAIAEEDAQAMRDAGLAHLLAVSGLHVTAVVGATMLIVLKLLALSPVLALRFRLPLVAAVAGAGAAIFYTWLTGAQVPTVRACIAALLVLAALSMGREAVTLRLVAAGALAVMLLWPETIASPSFQMSFAAVTAIVALHEHPRVKGLLTRREEGFAPRIARGALALLLTGLAAELTLMPVALYHFHKAGLYGAIANIAAIPLTTFVVMPLELVALLADTVGAGAPFWWLAERALWLLLWIAHMTAAAPGAVKALPTMADGAFALMVAGGLWIALWRTRARWAGVAPLVMGAAWAIATPSPDVIVTGDGRHVAIRSDGGELLLLRARAGDYVRSVLGETSGVAGEAGALEDAGDARCSPDLCVARIARDGRNYTIVATRSDYLVPIGELVALCRSADIVVSERRLPRTCTPRWLKLDRPALRQTGGIALTLAPPRGTSVRDPAARHPWRMPERVMPPRRSFQ